MNTQRSRSSITETLGNRVLSQEVRPALVLSMGTVAVGSAIAAKTVLHADVPVPLLLGLGGLSIVVPRFRAVVCGTLGAIWGLVTLLLCVVYAIVTLKDPGDYLPKALERIVNVVRGVPLSVQAPTTGNSPSREDPAPTESALPVEPLPAAVNAARSESEEIYWATIQQMAEQRPNGSPGIVQPSSSPDQKSKGRHAKAESEPSIDTGSESSAELVAVSTAAPS